MRSTIAMLLVCLGVGCGADDVGAPALSDAARRTGDETLTMLAEMTAVTREHAGDCDAIGAGLTGVLSAHPGLGEAAREHSAALEAHYHERAVRAMTSMLPVLDTCADNEAVRTVVTTMLEGDL